MNRPVHGSVRRPLHVTAALATCALLGAVLPLASPQPVLASGVFSPSCTPPLRLSTKCPEWIGASGVDASLTTMVRSPDGARLYAAGIGPGPVDVTMAFDSSGTLVWQASVDAAGSVRADAYSGQSPEIAVSPDGSRVFLLGTGVNANGGFVTVAYDAAGGTLLWSARYMSSVYGALAPSGIAVSPDGQSVYITGGMPQATPCNPDYLPFGGCDNYATVAYSTATGQQLWAAAYDDPAHGDDQATALALSPAGDVLYVTGESKNPTIGTEWDYYTIAYTTVAVTRTRCASGTCTTTTLHPGSRLWSARFRSGTHGIEGATALGLSPDGATVYVTGFTSTDDFAYCAGVSLPTHQYTTVAYVAATGQQLWRQSYNGTASGANGWNAPEAITVDRNNHVYVTGQATGPNGSCDLRFSTVVYDGATSTLLWSAQWSLEPLQASVTIYSLAVAVSPDATHVFVAGWVYAQYTCNQPREFRRDGCEVDAITVAYNSADGSQQWASRYNDRVCHGFVPNDDNQALAVSRDSATVYAGGNGCGGPQIMAFTSS